MQTNNLILNSLREVEEVEKLRVPEGYVEVKLSTNGKLGAPKSFHVRNFKVKDIIALSLTSESDLPSRLIPILNEMIFEDVDVANWHEKEVEELMVYIFITFYKRTLEDINFPVLSEDLDYLKEQNEDLYNSVVDKKWTPKTSLDIPRDTDTYDLEADFNPRITITNKTTGFHVTFDYIKYGDQLLVKKWLDSYFREEEVKFKGIKDIIAYNNNLSRQLRLNPNLPQKPIEIDSEEQKAYEEYNTKRLQVLTEVVRIVSIVDYNGLDVSNMSLSEKYELMSEDARIDYGLITKLSKRQQKQNWGIKPMVRMMNPITKKTCERRFSFRIPIILQACSISGDDNYDDGFGDET